MFDFFDPQFLVLLAQGGGGANAPQGPQGLLTSPLSLIIILGLMFYLLVLRPESRRRTEMQKLLAGIKKNDEVITVGGIWGIVANAPQDSEYVWLRLDDSGGTRLKVLRSSISRVLTAEKADEKKAGDKGELKEK